MTKERRLAIEMWEQIVEALEQGKHDKRHARPIASVIKDGFCEEHDLKWKCECWFCQYMRHDYRDIPSRRNISEGWEGCQHCPLYIEHEDILGYDECGCTADKETLWNQVWKDGNVHAAKRILELLKGGTNHE
jgi:hypothetical protein